MTTFIDEFQISDLTLCDSLLQLYNDAHDRGMTFAAVSYTHLTLPTICSV